MARKPRKNAGLIGLGIIGSRVAAALRADGFQVFVWNRTPKPEPNFLSSPAEVAEVCDVIQLFVADAHALFEVIDALADKLTPRHTIVCSATVGPEATIEAAQIVKDHGASFLDAPFTGSRAGAEKRELVYYIGGDDDTLRKAEPVLKASSKAILKIGTIGQAATVKVAANMVTAVTVQTLAEALAIVARSGVPPERFMEAFENNATHSALTDMKLPKMVNGEFDTHFSLKHMFKDVQLAIHIANSLAIDVPATTATAGVMYGGLNRGWADLDFCALVKVYQDEVEKAEEPRLLDQPEAPAEPPANSKDGVPPKETLAHMAAPPRPVEKPPQSPSDESKAAEASVVPAPAKETIPAVLKSQDPLSAENEGAAAATEIKSEDGNAMQQADAGDAAKTEPKPQSPPPFNRIRRWFIAGGAKS